MRTGISSACTRCCTASSTSGRTSCSRAALRAATASTWGCSAFHRRSGASDDTDPIERLDIQKGLSYLYPLSAMGAHVSASPHSQTLRRTPFGTRFAVSCFGCLGYELDLRELTPAELREAKRQVEFYKKHRMTLQYGRVYRFTLPEGREAFSCVARDGAEWGDGAFPPPGPRRAGL